MCEHFFIIAILYPFDIFWFGLPLQYTNECTLVPKTNRIYKHIYVRSGLIYLRTYSYHMMHEHANISV